MITEAQLKVGGKFWYIDSTGTITIPVTITSLPTTNVVGLVEHLPDGGTRAFRADIGTFLNVANVRTTPDSMHFVIGGVYLFDALGTGMVRCRVNDMNTPGGMMGITILYDDGTERGMSSNQVYFMAHAVMEDVVTDETGNSILKIVIVVAVIVLAYKYLNK